jgi:hypothetical protein
MKEVVLERNILAGPTMQLVRFAKKTKTEGKFREVFSSTNINQLITKINKIVEDIDCTDYEFGKPLSDCKLKIKGDLLEVFNVLYLETFGGDRSLFVFDIEFASRDYEGIDLFAKNKEGNIVSIQTKFIGNSNSVFESNRLETFFGKALETSVASKKSPTLILFTTASKVSERYKRMERNGSLTIIDKKVISEFASKSNVGFWNYCKGISEKLFI